MTLQDAKPWSNRCEASIAELWFLASTVTTWVAKDPVHTGSFFFSCYLGNRLLALDETNQDNDYRDNQEKMYESAKRVGGNEPEKPENEEDCGDGVQHGYDLNQVST